MLPGPSRNGSPQAVSRGMSVVYRTTVVAKPSREARRTAGVSRSSAISTPGTEATADLIAARKAAVSPTVRIVTSACAWSAITLGATPPERARSEEHTSELQSQSNLVCRLLLEKKKKNNDKSTVQHEANIVNY